MFQKKDVICFLGDSITANGLCMAEVYQVLRKKYGVKCYNCGVSGGSARNATSYLHSNCLIYNPDYVVILFGINDIDCVHYGEKYNDMEGREELLCKALEVYRESMEKLVVECMDSGAKVILCVPVPYDQISDCEAENYMCQRGLDQCEDFIRVLAEKYHCPIVDYKRTMLPMLGVRGVISPDRVHPTPEGYHVMAQTFLRDVGEIETSDFDTPFVMEGWNEARYNAEKRLSFTNFVEFCALIREGWEQNKTSEEKKQMARKLLEDCEDKTSYQAQGYQSYIDTIDQRAQLLGEIVRLTIY